MHERISVHSVTFSGAAPNEMYRIWRELGVRRLSLVDSQLDDPGLADIVEDEGYTVQTVYHLFAGSDSLRAVIDATAALGGHAVYLLTGARGDLTWEQAAERFCTAIAPAVDHARMSGVELAIENASALYADIHIAHTLRDTITLAESAGVGVCIDLFHCWAEAGLADLVQQALPRLQAVQLSDYVLGDRSLPARAVPGDGTIGIEPFLAKVLHGGYRHGIDIELIGPRIDAEGRLPAARRAGTTVTAMLDRLEGGGDGSG